jgi:hypothetical protein
MIKIHIISDLFLGFNEACPEEENIPDVDIVVLNGNIGQLKRSMFFAERLCRKYPEIQFVFNCGQTEYFSGVTKFIGEIDESLSVRKVANKTWPKNLHFSKEPLMVTCSNGMKLDIFCTYGYPKVLQTNVPWETTEWYRNHFVDIPDEILSEGTWSKPKQSSNVRHGIGPVFPSIEMINLEHKKETDQVRKWEVSPSGDAFCKMLITHINPYIDTRNDGIIAKPYLIHLNKGIWIGSNTKCDGVQFLGGRLYSNPGRGILARNKVIIVR